MSLSTAALRKMLDMGLTLEQAVELAEVWETGDGPSAAAIRQRRYRERKRGGDVTRDATGDVTEVTEALSLPPSPQTPHPPTHTRVSVHSRERDAREATAFERFWASYPRKVSKAEARRAYAKAFRKLPPFDEEAILAGGLERAKAAWTDAQFIPHAATWLNGERWNDEPHTPSPGQPHVRPDRSQPTAREDRLGRMLAGAVASLDEPEPELRAGGDGTGGQPRPPLRIATSR